jgi:hypothetical protein
MPQFRAPETAASLSGKHCAVTMKRVQLQLPEAVVSWIDDHAAGIESRASFVRRTLVAVMRREGRPLPSPPSAPTAATDEPRR